MTSEHSVPGSSDRVMYVVQAAVIAALYLVLTMLVAPIGYKQIQFRLSEVLTVLPALTPAGVPGLAVGCFLANLLNPESLGIVDVLGGTTASLLAALMTRGLARHFGLDESRDTARTMAERIRRPKVWFLTLPPILVNALIVGSYLTILLFEPEARHVGLWLLNMTTVGLGQLVTAGVGGVLLYGALAPVMTREHRRRMRDARRRM